MRSLRIAIVGGGLALAALVGACGLELGGLDVAGDSGTDAPTIDGSDMPMDIMMSDLGTGETESGAPCKCTPPLPPGWMFVAYDGMARLACPTWYASPLDVVENITASQTQCTCSCNGVMPLPSCSGDANFTYGFGTANNSCAKFTGTVSCNPGCKAAAVSHNGDYGDFAFLSLSGTITPSGGACNAPTLVNSQPQASSQQGRVCTLQGAPGACGSGACVPTPSGGYGVCIAQVGATTCPAEFPNTHLVGDGIDDTRTCGPDACACTWAKGTCSPPQVRSYWGSNDCSNKMWPSSPQAADGACKATWWVGDVGGIQSCKYTSSNSGATCSFAGSYVPQGMLAPTNVQTICCL